MFHSEGPSFFELARQALSSTEKGYDLLAPKFDVTPFRTPDETLQVVQNYLAAHGPFEHALDVCCGTGAGMEMLASVPARRQTGIDFSEGMIAQAKRNLKVNGGDESESRQFVRKDVFEMDWNEEFDLATCFGALGHILPRDESRFINHIANALRPNGRFVFVTHVMPKWYSKTAIVMRAFNASMWLRNLVIRPPFIMYYLTFLWPHIKPYLEEAGFRVRVESPFSGHAKILRLVDAVKAG